MDRRGRIETIRGVPVMPKIIQLLTTKIKCIKNIYKYWWTICSQNRKVFARVRPITMETTTDPNKCHLLTFLIYFGFNYKASTFQMKKLGTIHSRGLQTESTCWITFLFHEALIFSDPPFLSFQNVIGCRTTPCSPGPVVCLDSLPPTYLRQYYQVLFSRYCTKAHSPER